MCFSAEADLVAGAVVGAVGIDAMRHARRPAEKALAAIPVVLAAHLLIEAMVWWGLLGRLPDVVWRPALWWYLAIAFGLLPVLVPVAVGALEPAANRGRLRLLTVIGIGVSIALMYAVVRGPIEATIEGRYIDYRVELSYGGVLVALYVLVTCGSLLVSGHRHVRWFGAVNLVAVVFLAWLSAGGLISLWCAWATVSSVTIAWHLRHAERPREQLAVPST